MFHTQHLMHVLNVYDMFHRQHLMHVLNVYDMFHTQHLMHVLNVYVTNGLSQQYLPNAIIQNNVYKI